MNHPLNASPIGVSFEGSRERKKQSHTVRKHRAYFAKPQRPLVHGYSQYSTRVAAIQQAQEPGPSKQGQARALQ